MAGIYDLYSNSREGVIDWGDHPAPLVFLEFNSDGTSTVSSIMPRDGGNLSKGDTISSESSFSVSKGKDGCIDVLYWNNRSPDDQFKATLCGDLLTFRHEYEDEEDAVDEVYRKRH